MRYDLVIFDFDGTLADSTSWFLRVLNEVAARHRFRQVDPGELEELRGRPNREIVRRLRVPAWKLPAIARDVRARSAQAAGGISLFPGVGPLLESLHRGGAQIAIVSSNAEATVRAILGPELAGLVRWYDCGSSLFGKVAVMRRVLRRSAVGAARALAVGDEARDVEAARKAGLASAAVLWGYARRTAFEGLEPTVWFETPAEMRRFLTTVQPV